MDLSEKISLVFPHQLYEKHPVLDKEKTVVLIEDSLFFGDKHYPLTLHSHKIILHRASMKAYEEELLNKGYKVHYLNHFEYPNQEKVWEFFQDRGVKHCDIVDPVDFILNKRIKRWAEIYAINIRWHQSPNFINTADINENYFSGKKRFLWQIFYQHQRKRLNLMLDEQGNPERGKWSFDTENRKKLPKKLISLVPEISFSKENKWVKEAKAYTQMYFPDSWGLTEDFIYPIDRKGAIEWWQEFLDTRLHSFGPYEDAIVESKPFLYHGVLTPMLNIGLLNPLETGRRSHCLL